MWWHECGYATTGTKRGCIHRVDVICWRNESNCKGIEVSSLPVNHYFPEVGLLRRLKHVGFTALGYQPETHMCLPTFLGWYVRELWIPPCIPLHIPYITIKGSQVQFPHRRSTNSRVCKQSPSQNTWVTTQDQLHPNQARNRNDISMCWNTEDNQPTSSFLPHLTTACQ